MVFLQRLSSCYRNVWPKLRVCNLLVENQLWYARKENFMNTERVDSKNMQILRILALVSIIRKTRTKFRTNSSSNTIISFII